MHSLTRSVGQARTGTGKTGAYAIPVLQTILANKKAAGAKPHVAAIVLVVRRLRSLFPFGHSVYLSLCLIHVFISRPFLFISSTDSLSSLRQPTKELSKQVKQNFEELCKYCSELVSVVELSALVESVKEQKALLRDRPDVVVATAARVAARIADKSLDPSQVQCLVIDEGQYYLIVFLFSFSRTVSFVMV